MGVKAVTGSSESLVSSGLTVIWPMVPTISVVPSGAAWASSSFARLPAPPGRLSTTTGWPSRAESFGARMRMVMSTPPPAT